MDCVRGKEYGEAIHVLTKRIMDPDYWEPDVQKDLGGPRFEFGTVEELGAFFIDEIVNALETYNPKGLPNKPAGVECILFK